MRTIFIMLITGTVFLMVTSCEKFNIREKSKDIKGEGEVINHDIDFHGIHAISVVGDIAINVSQSNNYLINLQCQDNIFQQFNITKSDDELQVELKDNVNIEAYKDITLYFESPDEVNEIRVEGISTINIILPPQEQLNYHVVGMANINADQVAANNTRISGQGIINAYVNVDVKLEVNIEGQGSIVNSGEGEIVNHSTGLVNIN